MHIDVNKGAADILISKAEFATRRATLEKQGGFKIPPGQTPCQEIQRGMVDQLGAEIDACEWDLDRLGADHPSIPLLLTVPGIGPVLAYTIASEIGDIGRFSSPRKLTGYTGLCPPVRQSGNRDARGRWPRTAPSTCAGRSSGCWTTSAAGSRVSSFRQAI